MKKSIWYHVGYQGARALFSLLFGATGAAFSYGIGGSVRVTVLVGLVCVVFFWTRTP